MVSNVTESPVTSEKPMKEKGYKKLIVWQRADELAYKIYLETKHFLKKKFMALHHS